MFSIFKVFGKKYGERERKEEGEKREKRRKKGKKRVKINKEKNYDKICYSRGGKGYISPQSVWYVLGGKNIISEYDYLGNYIPPELQVILHNRYIF